MPNPEIGNKPDNQYLEDLKSRLGDSAEGGALQMGHHPRRRA